MTPWAWSMLLFLALAGAAIGLASLRRDGAAARAGWWIVAGLLVTAAIRFGAPPELQHALFGGVWLLVAARQSHPVAGLALVLSALCYLVPDLWRTPAASWSVFYLVANALGLIALGVVAFARGDDDVGRMDRGSMVGRRADRGRRAGGGTVALLAQTEKEGGP